MWAVCITSINHVLKLNGYGRRQAKVNGKRLRFKGWETLDSNYGVYKIHTSSDKRAKSPRGCRRRGGFKIWTYSSDSTRGI